MKINRTFYLDAKDYLDLKKKVGNINKWLREMIKAYLAQENTKERTLKQLESEARAVEIQLATIKTELEQRENKLSELNTKVGQVVIREGIYYRTDERGEQLRMTEAEINDLKKT